MASVTLTCGVTVLVDDEDVGILQGPGWSTDPLSGHVCQYYRRSDGKQRRRWLHRILCPGPSSMVVNHINDDPLDCRRENLQLITHSQLRLKYAWRRENRTGSPGVHWHLNGYSVRVAGTYLGRFKSATEAGKVADAHRAKLLGEVK